MGIFGFFRSKKESDLDALFQKVNSLVNPRGEQDVRLDCARIALLVKGKLSGEALKAFAAGCKALVAISDNYDDDGFVRSFVTRSGNVITETEARDVYVYLAGEASLRINAIRMASGNGHSLPDDFFKEIERLGKVWARGSTSDTISGGYGRFGLDLTNPVPTICIKGSNRYLGSLRYAGQPVDAKRLGSFSSSVTEGSVDGYAISIASSKVGTVYVCPYHRKDSKRAPEGFMIIR